MPKGLIALLKLLIILRFICVNYGQELTRVTVKPTTTTPSLPVCSCCESCSVAHALGNKVIESGKNRKRSNCDEVPPPSERDPSYQWNENNTYKAILIVVETFPPYINVSGHNSEDLEINGPLADLLAVLAQTVQFRYCLVRNPDQDFGVRFQNLTYTGIYGMVQNNEVDIALGPIFQTVDRAKIMDFSATVHFETLGALFGKPTVKRNVYNYAMAFTWRVWLVILITLCCVGATAVFLYTCGPDPNKNYPLTLDFAIEQFWLFFGVMVSQGMGSPPRRCPVRVLNSFWWLVAIVLSAYYNSKLIALMVTVKSYNSLDDLLLPDSDTNILISASTLADVKDAKSIYNVLKFKSDNGSDSDVLNDENMDLVATGNYAIVAFQSSIQMAVARRFKDREECEFNAGTDSYLFSKDMSIGYSKKMSQILRTKIDLALKDLYEKGVFKAMLRHVLNSHVKCMLSASVGGGAMSMDDVNGMLLLWLYGMTSALTLLMIEGLCYVFKFHKRSTQIRAGKKKGSLRESIMNRERGTDEVSGFVERRLSRRRQSRGFNNRPFYLAYNYRLPHQEYYFG